MQAGRSSCRPSKVSRTLWRCSSRSWVRRLSTATLSAASVISALEKRVEKLEREKFLLTEKAENMIPAKGRFGESIELALKFLSSPGNIYENGSLPLRQTVLRLAFVEPLRYSREKGYRTIETAIPFKVLAGLQGQNCQMVLLERIELSTSPLPRECSTSELQQPGRARIGMGVWAADYAQIPVDASSIWTLFAPCVTEGP